MTNRIRTGIALLTLSHGLVGCGGQALLTAPSAAPASVQQPNPQPTGVQPRITAIAPQVSSTRGGAWATITGVDFQPGARVRVGDGAVPSWTYDSTKISIWETAPHAAGVVDVIVINPGGLEDTLTGGYAYQAPESFDFNGEWIVWVGEYENDVRLTIRNNVVVSVSCDRSAPVTFEPPPAVRNGEFSFVSDDGLAITGRLVSPLGATGTINVPTCPAGPWWADKGGIAAGSRHAYARR